MTSTNITHVAAPAAAPVAEPRKMTPAEEREFYGADETGETTITFRGSIEVETYHEIKTYARTVTFTITHHVDHKFNTVRWNVEHPDRHCDAMFTPDSANGKPGTSIEGVLSTLLGYMNEQEGRHQSSRGWA